MARLKLVWAAWNNLIMLSNTKEEKQIASFLNKVYSWEIIYLNCKPILHGNKSGIDYYVNFTYVSEMEFEHSKKGVFIIEYAEPIIKIIGDSYLSKNESGNQEVISF